MRLFGRILGFVFAVTVAVLIGATLWLQDANRLKPELEALIADNSGYAARIRGDIKWVLFPPLQLKIQDLSLQRAGADISAASLELHVDLSAMWEDINQWRVTELRLGDAVLVRDEATTTLKRAELFDFRPGEPADFYVEAAHVARAGQAPLAATLDGTVVYRPATAGAGERVTLRDTTIDADVAKGVCQADLTAIPNPPANLPVASDDDLLPVALLLSYNLSAECELNELTLGAETFRQSAVEVTNVDGQFSVMLDVKDFLGGTLRADIDVDANKRPAAWTVLPEINNVDSQRLLDWTQRRMQWIAPVALNSTIRMRGNSQAELARSVQAQSEFDGGQGQLNIAKIKQQLMQMATFTRKSDEVAQWPDLWSYQQFTGRWNIDGSAHDLSFVLDNMNVKASGDYDHAADAINMLAYVTVDEAPETSPFRINPLLQGTPIPVRCQGAAADPKCRLDQDATKTVIARAMQRDDDSGLRQKLERKIEEDVPEQYRETARGLLDLLGRSLQTE